MIVSTFNRIKGYISRRIYLQSSERYVKFLRSKGLTIGDNCIIGAGSIITKDIPSNSVAVGMPCRVKCTIDEYYNRRKKEQINEAILFGKSIIKNLKRMPVLEDFKEEFGLFLPNDGCEKSPHFMTHVNMQVGGIYDGWKANHSAEFANFDEFLAAILKD